MDYHLFFMVLFVGTAFAVDPDSKSLGDQLISELDSSESVLPNENQEEEDVVRKHNLPLAETRRRLGLIVDKMDQDNDNKVTEKELDNWIVLTQTRYMRDETERVFKRNDINEDGKLYWDEYNEITYGINDEKSLSETNNSLSKKLLEKTKRKWNKANTNDDAYLTVEEFRAFLHPEEFRHMRDIVALETLEGIDKNEDGFVDMDEYMGDTFRGEDDVEPEWLTEEREQFSTSRDKNGDGKLDVKEVEDWLLPRDYDHANEEAKYLIYKADSDNDGNLTKEEIIAHHDTFLDSQATEWGATLQRHNEF